MPARSPEAVGSSALTPTMHPANSTTPGDDRVPPGSLLFIKTSAATGQLTLITAGVVDGDLAVADRSVTLPATGDRFVRIPTLDTYRDPADGLVGLTWSNVTGITFAVLS